MPARSFALALIPVLAVASSLAGGAPPTGPRPDPSRTPRPARFVAQDGATIAVHGTYPERESVCKRPVRPTLRARFTGTVEVGRDRDGSLYVIAEMPFEEYLEGIAEVPRSWPMEALKAQVVAARSYALSRMGRPDPTGARLGYDLCATDACQVFRGMGVSHGPYGDRWRRAVRETAGQVLLYRGRPAETLYSSTSPGRTLGNEEAFGTDPVPYLRPVDEEDDHHSPWSRWQVRMPFRDLERFLRSAGHWDRRPISSVRLRGSTVVVKGEGRTERLGVAEFRRHLNQWAPCRDPDRYPQANGGTRLPQTVPSVWFGLSSERESVVLDGRGWGHGVGMVQWGAYGKAKRGLSYGKILGAYYGGLRPERIETPDRIRVGVAVGLESVTIVPSGPVELEGRRPRPGPWRVTSGRSLRIRTAEPPAPSIAPGALTRVPRKGKAGRDVSVELSVPQLSVALLVLRVEERDIPLGAPETVSPGGATLTGRLPTVPQGKYELLAEVTDGVDVVPTSPVGVALRGPPPDPVAGGAPPRSGGGAVSEPPPGPSPTSPRDPTPAPAGPTPPPPSKTPAAAPSDGAGRGSPLPVLAPLAAVGLLIAGLVLVRGRRRRPSPPTDAS